jgi:KaiC/GvpD/RAD55 family RecA-like ATPase
MSEFDLDGTFPMGTSILLRGPPGSGKTEFLLDLANRWLLNREKVLYVAVSTSGEEILSRLTARTDREMLAGRLVIIDCYRNNPSDSGDRLVVNINGLSHLESITLAISTAVDGLGSPVRIIFDGLSTLFLHNAPQTMAKFFQVLSTRSKGEFGFILSSVVEGMHESVTMNTLMSLADGVIELEVNSSMARFIRVRYLKGRESNPIWYRYSLRNGRVELTAVNFAEGTGNRAESERIHESAHRRGD